MAWFVSPTDDDSEVPQQYQNVGFEDFRPLPNLGTLGLFVLVYLVKLIAFLMVLILFKLTGVGRKVGEALEKQLFFSEILMIFVEGYLDFCLAAFLFLSWDFASGTLNWIAFFFIAVLAFVFLPGLLIWTSKQPESLFEEEEFRSHWGVLYEDIRTQELGQRVFFLAFILRRAAFAGAAFWLVSTPSLQLVALNLSNLSLLIY
mmetsp:Transcript_10107/g.15435  ORF Transcript_10107/g.15435 Transcript_10107/m.15435 type:complete len:203 (-) Transcript_10107:119-727(-)